jgi:hypothetical protein
VILVVEDFLEGNYLIYFRHLLNVLETNTVVDEMKLAEVVRRKSCDKE